MKKNKVKKCIVWMDKNKKKKERGNFYSSV